MNSTKNINELIHKKPNNQFKLIAIKNNDSETVRYIDGYADFSFKEFNNILVNEFNNQEDVEKIFTNDLHDFEIKNVKLDFFEVLPFTMCGDGYLFADGEWVACQEKDWSPLSEFLDPTMKPMGKYLTEMPSFHQRNRSNALKMNNIANIPNTG